MNNNSLNAQRDEKNIKEEVYGERLIRNETKNRRQRMRTRQDDVLDSLIMQAKELATSHLSASSLGKEREIQQLLKTDYFRLIETEKMGYLKAYSIIKLAETMLLEMNRHFPLTPIK